MKLRNRIAAIAAGTAIVAGAGLAMTSGGPANASGTTLQTVSKTETIISAKCYHSVQTTKTYYHWSVNRYVLYSAGPKVTVTTQNVCHA
jgi:hypothetical protein